MNVTNATAGEADELSEDELCRMERLAESASVGPWISYIVGRDAYAGWNRVELGACNELGTFQSFELVGAGTADQDFIASARQDVPRLVRAVRGLRARLGGVEGRSGAGDSPVSPAGSAHAGVPGATAAHSINV